MTSRSSVGAVVVEDTRQQAGKHANVERWMRAHGVAFLPRARALPFGDYVAETPGGEPLGNVSVDTKRSLEEVASNLTREHDRFARECDRAAEAGWRLVVLVEGMPTCPGPEAVGEWAAHRCAVCRRCRPGRGWACPRRLVTPAKAASAAKAMATMAARHGVAFEFCGRADTGRRICELLGVGWDG